MIGPFLASGPTTTCTSCRSRIRTGGRIYYDSERLNDSHALCESCISFDLFGAAS